MSPPHINSPEFKSKKNEFPDTLVDTDVKQLEGNQEVLTIGDAKDASTDEEEAINFKGCDFNLA